MTEWKGHKDIPACVHVCGRLFVFCVCLPADISSCSHLSSKGAGFEGTQHTLYVYIGEHRGYLGCVHKAIASASKLVTFSERNYKLLRQRQQQQQLQPSASVSQSESMVNCVGYFKAPQGHRFLLIQGKRS